MALQTQWRHAGFDGVRTGLDYAAACAFLQTAGYRRKQRARLLGDILECEKAALREWKRQR